MMHEPEKSDSAVVATKPTNKAGRPVAEPVEPRAGTKGKADQQSTCRAQNRVSVSQALDRVRQDAVLQLVASYPRQEPDALIGPVRICAGGAG